MSGEKAGTRMRRKDRDSAPANRESGGKNPEAVGGSLTDRRTFAQMIQLIWLEFSI
jgi:hypothetical protein